MTSSMLRRQLKNLVQNYSEAEVKVREATSNDPWGPSSTQMADLSDLTYNVVACNEIMTMLWKRLKDDKNWRHIHKSLTLLEYLLKTGDDRVLLKMKDSIYIVKALTEYRFVEKDGKDQGGTVREKAKVVLVLMEDDEKLKEERDFAVKTREKTSKSSAASSLDVVKDPSYTPCYVAGASGLPSLDNIPSVADLTASFTARKEERIRQETEKKETERRAKLSEDELKWEDAGKDTSVKVVARKEEKEEKEEVKPGPWGAPKEPKEATDPWGKPTTPDTTEKAASSYPWGGSTEADDQFAAPKTDEDPFAAPQNGEDPFVASKDEQYPFNAPKDDPFNAPKDDPFNAPKDDPFNAPKDDPFNAPKDDPFNAPKDDPFNAPKDDPFNAPKDDPFNAPKDDPFNAPQDDPFNSPKDDPFNSPKDDPFNAPKDDPFNAPKEDPFNAPKEDPFNAPKDDPFNAPKDDPFNAPKDDPFNSPKDDPFNAPKDDPFNAPKDDPFNAPKDDPFNSPKDDPFNSPKDDPFNSPKDDPFNSPKEDPFNAPKEDPFNAPKDDPFNASKDDLFTAPASTPPKEDPISAPSKPIEDDPFGSPTTPPQGDSFSASSQPTKDDPFSAPTTSPKEDPFFAPSKPAQDYAFTAPTTPPKEDPFPSSALKNDASDPFGAPAATSPQESADAWGAPASSPPATVSDPWETPSTPKEANSGDPWGDEAPVTSATNNSDPFGDASQPDNDPWGAPASAPASTDDAWGSAAPPSASSPANDPFGDGASKANDPWGKSSNATSNATGKRTMHKEETYRKTAHFLGSAGASLVDLDDLCSSNATKCSLTNAPAAHTQAIGLFKSMLPDPGLRSGAVAGVSLPDTPPLPWSPFGATLMSSHGASSANPSSEPPHFQLPCYDMGASYSGFGALQAAPATTTTPPVSGGPHMKNPCWGVGPVQTGRPVGNPWASPPFLETGMGQSSFFGGNLQTGGSTPSAAGGVTMQPQLLSGSGLSETGGKHNNPFLF
ncbi:epsin-1-like [Platichthys flesus]|uniref:epsin-1-like n=1 Tax=Platichthys flesus TaxID=8260 RepID=UPI002DBE27AB|nr:epsin-1-like [Platichthys flesus]